MEVFNTKGHSVLRFLLGREENLRLGFENYHRERCERTGGGGHCVWFVGGVKGESVKKKPKTFMESRICVCGDRGRGGSKWAGWNLQRVGGRGSGPAGGWRGDE